MALIDGATIDARFSNFSILQTDYKNVGNNGIRADLLIPKSNPAQGKRPVIAQFHGGGLVSCAILKPYLIIERLTFFFSHVQIFGDSLHSDWFPIWILGLAQK